MVAVTLVYAAKFGGNVLEPKLVDLRTFLAEPAAAPSDEDRHLLSAWRFAPIDDFDRPGMPLF